MPTVYYIVGNGLGNIIQTTPAFQYLRKCYNHVTVYCHPKWREFTDEVYRGEDITSELVAGRKTFKCCSPNDFKLGGGISEVELNLKKVGLRSPARWSDKIGFCGYEDYGPSYDVLLCDGYNKRKNGEDWKVKSYAYWSALARILRLKDGLRVASIGSPEEYIKGSINETGIGLGRTLGLIKNAKVLVSNDTGFYHAANALRTNCVVVFTMTDREKNYDPDFHRYTRAVHTDLPCQPCQLVGRTYWLKNYPRCKWACREVPLQTVVEQVRSSLHESTVRDREFPRGAFQ